MFNLFLWLLLIQSGAGVKAISWYTRLLVPLQTCSWWWFSWNKESLRHCEGVGSVFSHRGSSVHLPERDRFSFQTSCQCKVWGELSRVQITGASTGVKQEEFGSERERCEADRNLEVDVLSEWDEGKIQIIERERKWQSNWKRQFPLFPAFFVRGR